MKKSFIILSVLLVYLLSSCGTILYPERRGQRTGGRIDAGVAVLDGVGLIFFIIPGLIAYTVDFATGCIYVNDGGRRAENLGHTRLVFLNPDKNLYAQFSLIDGEYNNYKY